MRKEELFVGTYSIPEEIGRHNIVLNPIRTIEVNDAAMEVLLEYESIIKVQYKGIQKLREDKLVRRGFSGKESGLIGDSREIRHIRNLIFRIQHSDAPILIQAETGCGKEVIAAEVVRYSMRWEKPFIKVNCSAFPEALFESELFGYAEGAFTGALRKGKKGFFEAADGGTIFLDEIGELPMSMQAKLLRVLQEHEVVRVGDTVPIPIDVRVIAATNRDLRKLVNEGTFRKDLYFRLNVMPLYISPLRNRKEDIPVLAKHFMEKYSNRYDHAKSFTQEGLDALCAYDWPGNVRELENIVERLVAWGTSERIKREDILIVTRHDMENPLSWYEPEKLTLKETLEVVEKNVIADAMHLHGSTRKAAAALGISQSSLMRRLQQYQIFMDPID